MTQGVDQETQVAKSDLYDDERGTGVALETGAQNLRDDLNALRSQFKRVIHGADAGKWYDDPATVFGGDASLHALYEGGGGGGIAEYQKDLYDNASDYIAVANALLIRAVDIFYSFQLPISGRQFIGKIRLQHDGSTAGLIHDYDFMEPEITGVTFGAALVGTELRLTITCASVGENPKMRYKKFTLSLAA